MDLSLVHTFLPASSSPQTIVWHFPLSPLPHQISSTSSSQSFPVNLSWLSRCILVRGSSPSDILRPPIVSPFLVYRSQRRTPRVCLKHDRGIRRHFHSNDQSSPPLPPVPRPCFRSTIVVVIVVKKNVPRRSTIQRTSSKMRHARLICTTRSVRTRDLTNWFVTLRYASFGNIERDATAAIPRRGMRTSGTNDRQCTRSSFVVSHAVRRRRRCRRRGVDRDGHHRHAARPHGRTLVGRRPIRRWRAGVSRCLVDTDIAPCPRDERRPVRCRDGRWGGRIKSAPRADDDDGKRGGGGRRRIAASIGNDRNIVIVRTDVVHVAVVVVE